MSSQIGPSSFPATAARSFARPSALDGASASARAHPATGVDSVDLSLPSGPPAEVLEKMAAAAELAAELAAANRELHFQRDETSGRIVVQVRDLVGRVIRTIPPSGAIELMEGERSWAMVRHG